MASAFNTASCFPESSSESAVKFLDPRDCNDFGWPKALGITLDPDGSMEHHSSLRSFWSGDEFKGLGLYPDDGHLRKANHVSAAGNALIAPLEEDAGKFSAATYRGVVYCGGSQTTTTVSHPNFPGSACCRSGEVEYCYRDEIIKIELPKAMADLATELDEADEHVSVTTLKLHDLPSKLIAAPELQGIPVYLANNLYIYSAPVSRFSYDADLSITRIPDISGSSDDANADVEEVRRTTKAWVTIQRAIVCNLGRSTETSDTGPAVSA